MNIEKFLIGFTYAFNGVRVGLQQLNLRVHFFVATIVVSTGLFLRITNLEWAILVITIGLVISLELVNTAIESVVDLVTNDYHVLAKKAKDVAAGAVLVSAIASVFIGILIFLPYLFKLLFP